ncbi:hypothetical protein D9M73_153890 [compost metagenome]
MMPMIPEPRPPRTMPTDTGTLSTTPCSDLPARTMLEAKKPMYITPAITTTSNAPSEPN